MTRSTPWLVPSLLLACWSAFVVGLLWQGWVAVPALEGAPRVRLANASMPLLAVASLWAIAISLWRSRATWSPPLRRALDAHTAALDSIPKARIGFWILATAAVGLFAELMMIRIHASFFQLFAYYKNLSLLSCFLGLGIGYALGDRRSVATPLVLPALSMQILLLHVLRSFGVGELLQNPVSEQAALGLDTAQGLAPSLTVYGFLLAVFATNALCFVPLGQLTSRLMGRCDRLAAYAWNLAGSVAGIAVFSLLSFAWTPPSVWLLGTAGVLLPLLWGRRLQWIVSALAVAASVVGLGLAIRPQLVDLYTPYQILTLDLRNPKVPTVNVSNAYFQRILDLRDENVSRSGTLRRYASYYAIPYWVKPEPGSVLVVGAGTGNDVAAALRHGARHVDAVEIDPAILHIGERLHPEAPYASDRVRAVVDDARSFLRHTDRRYDLIVYGLLDSHSLLSGVSNVRLDSFVYTAEAFHEARSRLEPGGVLCLTFAVLSPEMGRKLYLMLEQAFEGEAPRALRSGYDAGVTFLASEHGVRVPEELEVTELYANPDLAAEISTDDWPFFYMPERTWPRSYVAVIGLLLIVSLLFVRHFLSGSGLGAGSGFSVPCFFLGAGFMLMETKAITELALVYGSTWLVVSAVITAILVLAFLANALVARVESPRAGVVYPLLLLSLVVCWQLAGLDLSGLPSSVHRLALTVLLTLPLFFAGLAFSTELKTRASVPAALSANLMGSMLGGFLEYNSMVYGFESLWLLALAMYAAAFASRFVRR